MSLWSVASNINHGQMTVPGGATGIVRGWPLLCPSGTYKRKSLGVTEQADIAPERCSYRIAKGLALTMPSGYFEKDPLGVTEQTDIAPESCAYRIAKGLASA